MLRIVIDIGLVAALIAVGRTTWTLVTAVQLLIEDNEGMRRDLRVQRRAITQLQDRQDAHKWN